MLWCDKILESTHKGKVEQKVKEKVISNKIETVKIL